MRRLLVGDIVVVASCILSVVFVKGILGANEATTNSNSNVAVVRDGDRLAEPGEARLLQLLFQAIGSIYSSGEVRRL